jgi:hypothetical protein
VDFDPLAFFVHIYTIPSPFVRIVHCLLCVYIAIVFITSLRLRSRTVPKNASEVPYIVS